METAELQETLKTMKEAMKQAIKLSPLDISEKLYTLMDAAVTMGMCYILVQRKDETGPSKGSNIFSCDLTTFKRGQVGLRPSLHFSVSL